ncbi:hypothetical protein BDA99DRAFT_542367 [Phascolomyces articulosus]|uniref:Uncharacterized protein n=1 Tax=Phascolomyces articulosus TaxID=60185 RepID=A0AAD5PAE6_9FUNG|nr:hypothetical protein BDA99DRAFT_542367 [Phascolomyces articulosus]
MDCVSKHKVIDTMKSMNTETTLANTRLCKKCKCHRAIEMFAGNTREYRTCVICRNRESDVDKPVPEEWLISFEEALLLAPSRYDDDENINTAHGERAFIEYTLDVYIHLDYELLELDEETILTRIRTRIEGRDGYHYYQEVTPSPALKFARSFCCRCSQDYDVQRQVLNVDRRRLDSRMETYLCGGHIQGMVDKRNRYAHINVEHSTGHPALPVSTMYQVNEEIRTHILQNCITMDAHALYLDILDRFPNTLGRLTQPQVYYWWNRSFETQYRLANNQYESARLLIE